MVALAFTLADCTQAQRDVYDAINSGDFTGTGCRHSQAMIAARIGRSRVHVSRCAKALEAMDLIEVDRPRNRRDGNTYRVREWSPTLRKRVIAECRVIRAAFAQRAQCDKKRTAELSRAQTPWSTPSPQCHKDQRCGRGRARCERKDARFVDERHAALLAEVEQLTEEVSGLMSLTRQQARREQALKRELNRVTESDPKSEDVRAVLDAWKRLCGHPRAKCPTDGKAWKVTLRAMRHHSRQEVMEAIEGLALMPYVGAHGRQAAGKPAERYDDVEHALKDETTIRRFRTYRARTLGASSLDLFGVYEALAAEADLYLRAAVTRWHREELKRLPASERAAMDVATMRRLREWGLIDTDATTEFLTSQGLIDPTSRVAA